MSGNANGIITWEHLPNEILSIIVPMLDAETYYALRAADAAIFRGSLSYCIDTGSHCQFINWDDDVSCRMCGALSKFNGRLSCNQISSRQQLAAAKEEVYNSVMARLGLD